MSLSLGAAAFGARFAGAPFCVADSGSWIMPASLAVEDCVIASVQGGIPER